MYKVKPRNSQVLLEKYVPIKKKKSKIILPDHTQERMDADDMPFLVGKVIGVGELVGNTKVGDVVLYEAHVPIIFKLQGKDYSIIKEEYITAHLEKSEKPEAEA